MALIVASMSWSVASALTRKLTLPPSRVMSSGAQMLAGGVFLTLTAAALGEFRDPADERCFKGSGIVSRKCASAAGPLSKAHTQRKLDDARVRITG
jgi:hypothetical protein